MVRWRKVRKIKERPKRSCLLCGAEFVAYRTWQKFCSPAHKTKYHNKNNVTQRKSVAQENVELKERIKALEENISALKAKLAKITKPLLS